MSGTVPQDGDIPTTTTTTTTPATPAMPYAATISVTPVGGNYSAGFTSGPLEDWEKADCRRFAGYAPYGGRGVFGFWGYRFFQEYGLLEYRMNNLAPAEYQVVRYHLNFLVQLEVALVSASNNLDTDQASVWKHNKQETADRRALYHEWRMHLCRNLGVPPGPALGGSGGIVI
jgi:hypothetical protein